MSDFTIRSGSVDVEEIMRHIRTRIREKRGVDYTEEQIRELATVKLEKFLDPKQIRSDLLEHYRRRRSTMSTAPELPAPPDNYGFEHDTIYLSSRGVVGRLIGLARRLLNPLLKLFFNPNPMIEVLHRQSEINRAHGEMFDTIAERLQRDAALREELDALNFEVLNNVVVEMTKLGIEVKNLRMRLESLSSRMDFDERRARALEGIVQYRSEPARDTEAGEAGAEGRRRRRRRRKPRRGGPESGAAEPGAAEAANGPTAPADGAPPSDATSKASTAPAGEETPPLPADGPDPEAGAGPPPGGETDPSTS